MFVWKAETIISEIRSYLPELYTGLQEIKKSINTNDFQKVLTDVYSQTKSISIDYGIMEKSHNAYLVKATFNWSDVGSWEEVYQLSDKDECGNSSVGESYTYLAENTYIHSPKKFCAVIGVDNLMVIETDDALLICDRNKAQDVKKVVDYLKMKKLNNYI